jgi:hypothetical protein
LVGRRKRTVYTITAEGRRALASWLAEPGQGPVLEFEQLMKIFFSDHGSTDDIRRQLAEARAWAHERTLVNIDVGRSYLDGTSPFPERTAINILVGRFLDDFLETVDRWAQWATEATEEWPAHPGEAPVDAEALAATVRQAEERSSRWRAGPVQPPRS